MNSKRLFIFSLIVLTFLTVDLLAQEAAIPTDSVTNPSFPGGHEQLVSYMEKNFSWRQTQPLVQGKVFVEFRVDVDGKIKDVKIARGLCETCDKEAIRLITGMPRWVPGTKNGKGVESKLILPIKFGM